MAFSFEPFLAISAGHFMAVSAGPEQPAIFFPVKSTLGLDFLFAGFRCGLGLAVYIEKIRFMVKRIIRGKHIYSLKILIHIGTICFHILRQR